MATRTIVTCDLCKAEIKPGERLIYFGAKRLDEDGYPIADFERNEFCSDACVLAAVRGLLNGTAK